MASKAGWTVQDLGSGPQCSITARAYNQAIVSVNGARVWQMSNSFTTGGFRDQPFSPTTAQAAGETNSSLWNGGDCTGSPLYGANATTSTFYARWDFASATGAAQPGLSLVMSASAKQSAVRMTWVQLQDNGATGIDLNFYQTNATGGFPTSSTSIATDLSYADLHSVEMAVYFQNGFYNDVVNVFLNGTLIHTGKTWESYYQFNEPIAPGQPPRLQAVNSLLVRAAGVAAPATAGEGYVFHTITVSTTIPPTLPIAQPTEPGENVVVTFDESIGSGGSITFNEVTTAGVTVGRGSSNVNVPRLGVLPSYSPPNYSDIRDPLFTVPLVLSETSSDGDARRTGS